MFEFARGEVDKLLHSEIIEPSASDWRSAPVISWRDDKGRMRFDYCHVNKAMKKDAYLIPNVDAILDRLRYEAFHVNCPSARPVSPKSCYF